MWQLHQAPEWSFGEYGAKYGNVLVNRKYKSETLNELGSPALKSKCVVFPCLQAADCVWKTSMIPRLLVSSRTNANTVGAMSEEKGHVYK